MTGQQLKNSILQEAIQGHLVSNVLQPGEMTGEELLKDILAERQKKKNEEKGEKAKKLSLSLIEEEPWELPGGWCWCLLKDVCSVIGGYAFPSQDLKDGATGIRVIRISDVTETGLSESRLVRYRGNMSLQQYEIKVGDILMAMTGGTVGKSLLLSYLPEPLLLNQRVAAIRNQYFNIRYLDIVLKSPLTKAIIEQAKNSTNDNISMADINGFMVPFPPLSIQEAIVEKIDELLPLIDEYDKAAVELETLNKVLPDKLRKSVLQEAIHGNLVPNDIPDGEATGAELLQQILNERQEKENKEKGKKAKKLTLSEVDDDVEELPNGWCWCKLSDIGECLYGVSESAKTHGTYKLLRITDIQDNTVNWGTVPLSDYKKNDVAKYFLLNNDLVFARTGGTVGKSYLIQDVPSNAIYASYLIRVRFQGNALLPKYIKYFFQSPQYWSQIIENSEGTGQPNCNGTKLANLNIPLPPLTIQHRIVEKIEEVFSATDKLQA